MTFLDFHYLNSRKLNPRLTDAEIFDIVKTSTDCVLAANVGDRPASAGGKHLKDDTDHVSGERQNANLKLSQRSSLGDGN